MLTLALFLLLEQAPATAPVTTQAKPAETAAPAAAPKATAAAKPVEAPKAVEAPRPPEPPRMAPAPVVHASGPELLQVKNVYILAMGSGFDQYLATSLTRGGVIQVVTDPNKADAVFSDRLGEGFEAKMKELYPEPEPEPKARPARDKDKDGDKDKDEDRPADSGFDVKNPQAGRNSTFGRGKGTYFLVMRGSRNVVWSIYEKPKTIRPVDLEKSARKVARKLDDTIKKGVGATEK